MILCIPATAGAPCQSGTVAMNVTTAIDVQTLIDELDCTGYGAFHITWYRSLVVGQTIDVSHIKTLTVTGVGFPTIGGPLGDERDAGTNDVTTNGSAIFKVSAGSVLRLNSLAIEGGTGSLGGAVTVISLSSLVVFNCTFANNSASIYGGESKPILYNVA